MQATPTHCGHINNKKGTHQRTKVSTHKLNREHNAHINRINRREHTQNKHIMVYTQATNSLLAQGHVRPACPPSGWSAPVISGASCSVSPTSAAVWCSSSMASIAPPTVICSGCGTGARTAGMAYLHITQSNGVRVAFVSERDAKHSKQGHRAMPL